MASIAPDFLNFSGIMKITLAITQRCNLACNYCYIKKNNSVMSLNTAAKIIDFVFQDAREDEKIEIGFFGGEPLLEIDLIKKITEQIRAHKSYDKNRIILSVTTNGTIYSEDLSQFLADRNIILNISCDGPPKVQDASRHFPDGSGSSRIVEKNIMEALKKFPLTPVNAVYSPESLHLLPDIVDYLASIGIRNIYLNPNISAKWTKKDADSLPEIYGAVAQRYIDFYRRGEPRYISLIDSAIALILRGGYSPLERCKMGNGEYAFGPSGNIYPCERLIGSDSGKMHCIGNINTGFVGRNSCKALSGAAINRECQECGIKDYCMNWCGCTNYYSTGHYNVVGPFICASEKASINTALQLIQKREDYGLDFSDHIRGMPLTNVITNVMKGKMH